jgi:Raf kinase inhibitor-like YbhB/YbcL family protein
MDDPDAPQGTWVPWLLINSPAKVHNLPTGGPRTPALANGAAHGQCWGVKRWHRVGYQRPMPPAGATHHYRFVLRALDTMMALPSGCTLDQVHHASQEHVQAEAQLIGVESREPATMMR